MTTEITRIKQSDGAVRVIRAQDAEHAARARAILRDDPAMIDHLDGVDGIETRWVSVMGLDPTPKAEEKIKITMSERRPLSIVKDEWPVIARADRHDGKVQVQANHEWTIRVREHADGRRIVYGWLRAGNGGVYAGWRGAEGGYLLPAGADESETIRAIRRVAGIIGDDKLGDECIADLPAEDDAGSAADTRTISMPLDGAKRLVDLLNRVNGCLRADPTCWTIDGSDRESLRAVTEELRRVVTARMAKQEG